MTVRRVLRVVVKVGLPARRLHRRRQKAVEQARIRQIAGLAIGHSCSMAMASALGQPAMDLPFDDHRTDARAAIIERVEAADLGDAAVDVDIDDADLGTERVGHVRRAIIADRFEPRLHARRKLS